ncbi:hypothetical protein D4R42_05495 [bacterium]|nr:MAG: hypothetical protein D4R42_05495 [bacterium]
MTAVKVETLIFCPDCLQRMKNGKRPNLYQHINQNKDCSIVNVELNSKREISKLFYFDGAEKIIIDV